MSVLLLTAQLVFPGMFGSLQHWSPLYWAHIPDGPYSLSHPSLGYFTGLLPAVTFLGSELGALLCWWLVGTVLWEFRACSHGLQEPPTRLPGSMMAVLCVGALRREQGRILCERS